MTEDLTLHMRHVRAAKLCSRGAREWFARNGFSWSDFLTNGIPASKVLPLDDAIVARVIKMAEMEKRDGR